MGRGTPWRCDAGTSLFAEDPKGRPLSEPRLTAIEGAEEMPRNSRVGERHKQWWDHNGIRMIRIQRRDQDCFGAV